MNDTQHTRDPIHGAISAIETIGTEHKYREAVEALNALEALSWFDNFGEPFYRHRIEAMRRVAEPCELEGSAHLNEHVRETLTAHDIPLHDER